MCLIAYTTCASRFLTADEEANTNQHNPDGTGVMFFNRRRTRVITRKTMKYLEAVEAAPPSGEFAMHWRYATHGATDRDAAHPHWVTNKDWGDPEDLALMHNGVLAGWGGTKRSDTQEFAEFLRDVFRKDPSLPNRAAFWAWLEQETAGSRLLFCGTGLPGGWLATPALDSWSKTDNGTLISNTYSLDPLRPRVKTVFEGSLVPFQFISTGMDGVRRLIRYDENGRTETVLPPEETACPVPALSGPKVTDGDAFGFDPDEDTIPPPHIPNILDDEDDGEDDGEDDEDWEQYYRTYPIDVYEYMSEAESYRIKVW